MSEFIIYDSNCNLCTRIKNFLKKIDFLNYFNWLSIEDYKVQQDKFIKINPDKLDSSFAIINKNDKVLFEFEACKYLVARIPVLYPFLIFFYIPFLSKRVGTFFYKKISANRQCNQK